MDERYAHMQQVLPNGTSEQPPLQHGGMMLVLVILIPLVTIY